MMQHLIDTLHSGQDSLVILHEGRLRSFGGQGLRKLYNIAVQEPELLLGAKLADKAVGRTAARVMAEGGVAEIYADYISDQAYDLLIDANIKVTTPPSSTSGNDWAKGNNSIFINKKSATKANG